jgi:hypothetical protein
MRLSKSWGCGLGFVCGYDNPDDSDLCVKNEKSKECALSCNNPNHFKNNTSNICVEKSDCGDIWRRVVNESVILRWTRVGFWLRSGWIIFFFYLFVFNAQIYFSHYTASPTKGYSEDRQKITEIKRKPPFQLSCIMLRGRVIVGASRTVVTQVVMK